jgi:hypothetical protein
MPPHAWLSIMIYSIAWSAPDAGPPLSPGTFEARCGLAGHYRPC